MMKINSFDEYNTLYVFDFDDTLVDSPRFEDTILKYLKEEYTSKDLLRISLERSGCKISDLRWENGRIFVFDPNKIFREYGNWKRKGDRLYLLSPNIFSKIDDSLPKKLKPTVDIYKSVENNCIITARPESIRDKITKVLVDLGLDYPKYGLHMLPDKIKNAGHWKGEKIVEIVKETGHNKVIFYDDNSKYLSKATKVIKNKIPNLDWNPIKVADDN
jgi:hypothetical protein